MDANAVVWISHKDGERCVRCGENLTRGDFIQINREQSIYCMKCVGFDELVFLPSGDAALTRRAVAHSLCHAVVMRFSSARNRNERQGVLVEKAALARAQEECAKDAAKREATRAKRRVRDEVAEQDYLKEFTRRILKQFPSCPAEEAEEIAQHACQKYSGRVGRSAAAKAFDPKAVELTVRAHVRHVHTKYETLLGQNFNPHDARTEVRDSIDRVLERWRAPRASPRGAARVER